ncbi:TPA: CatB-related O-acetyltransferase [Escherichia coli]|nr:CatB-related O-acetyltransferase [Escherichia coli]
MTEHIEHDLDYLILNISSLYFQYSREDGSYMVSPIRLLESGEIYGHSHPNEDAWAIDQGELRFLTKDGRISTAFGKPFLEDGMLTFTGDFLLRPQLKIKHKIKQIDFTLESLDTNPLITKNALKDLIKQFKWDIGDHTYGKPKVLEPKMAGLKIGKFCSIAGGVTLILGNHNTNTATTYPFTALRKYWPGARRDAVEDHHSNGDIIIGNDVWIGNDATIMSGITIGDGAVIAANSVVTKDVKPYAIVGGTPAKLLRMRHDEEVVSELLQIKWWEWSDEIIDERIKFLLSDINEFIARFK